ncbi:hypothetical protein DSO57_1029741 [Entomophthora muscae]|uniref:Uncharacterized protein n=1 Tax=Entomophthora muscae TaxID=34485 RepID=A0ACC2TZB4_9FUNG|nr:hypothetical protein DSO57_1029741 [Entomophthora muscae]
MISACHIIGFFLFVVGYKVYSLFAVPRELKDVPLVSLGASLVSMLSGESFELRFERLIRPVLQENGMARMWNQGRWDILLNDTQQIKDIMSDTERFTKRKGGDINSKLMLASKILGMTNLASADGDEWRRHRRVANPAFKKTWSTTMFGDCTTNLINLIQSANGAPLQVQGLFQRLTLDVLGKGLFSFDFEAIAKGEENHYLSLYNEIMKAMMHPIYAIFPFLEALVPWRRASHQKAQEFRDFLRGIIRNRKAELTEDHDDLLSLMTKASMDDKEEGLNEEEVINDLSIFFLAGHDTTANTLTTTFYYLAKHPEIQEKVRQEVNAVLNGEKRIPTAEELKQLHYIDCIIKESMRIVTTVPQLRRYCKDGYTLTNGFAVPKDTFVTLQMWNVHHDNKVYPDPYSFNPDRFKEAHGPEKNQWMAFGFGSRMCIGKNFSLMEQKVALACLLQTFTCLPGPNIVNLSSPKLSNGLVHPINVDIIFELIA